MGAGSNQERFKSYWLKRGESTARRINYGWILSYFLPLAGVASAIFCAIVIFQKQRGEYSSEYWIVFFASILILLLVGVLRARSRAVDLRLGLIQLESHLKLNNSLSTAFDGVAPWPRPGPSPEPNPTHLRDSDGLSWKLREIGGSVALTFCILIAVAMLPTATRQVIRNIVPVDPPVSIEQVEKMLDKLSEQSAVKSEFLEETKSKIEELKSMPEEKWYDHSSLEAAESLREQVERKLDALLGNLERADALLDGIDKSVPGSEAERDLLNNLREQARSLQSGDIAADNLSESLNELPESLSENREKQLGESRKTVRGGIKALRNALKKGAQSDQQQGSRGSSRYSEQNGESSLSQGGCSGGSSDGPMCGGDDTASRGMGDGDSMNGEGDEIGSGGISRGPGTAPLNLSENSPRITSNRLEQLSSTEVEAEDLQEIVGLSAKAPQKGDHDESTGAGGAVNADDSLRALANRDSFLPKEREILKKFYSEGSR